MSDSVMMKKERVEWIDLAKGLCMMLVVFGHTAGILEPLGAEWMAESMSYFRMPLYFMLSGLFFKTYDSFSMFLCKKFDHLLFPYLFFFAVQLTCKEIPLQAIWFLFSLFCSNILFYTIYSLCMKMRREILIYPIVMAIGVMGYYCHMDKALEGVSTILQNHTMYFECAMTCLPFFVAGYAVRKHTPMLSQQVKMTVGRMAFVVVAAVIVSLAGWYEGWGDTCHFMNEYYIPVVPMYITGIVGSMMVLQMASVVGRIPGISYIGRYSIVVLVTHLPLIKYIGMMMPEDVVWRIALFAVVLVAEIPVIYVCIRYFPVLFAQKELTQQLKKWQR